MQGTGLGHYFRFDVTKVTAMKSDCRKNTEMTSAEHLDAAIKLFFGNIEWDVTQRSV